MIALNLTLTDCLCVLLELIRIPRGYAGGAAARAVEVDAVEQWVGQGVPDVCVDIPIYYIILYYI